MALSRARELAADVAVLNSDYPGLQRFAEAAAGLATYIENNAAAIPDYGERRRYAEPISTAFAESTVNLVVGKRFAKKQQMNGPRPAPTYSCRPSPRPWTAPCRRPSENVPGHGRK